MINAKQIYQMCQNANRENWSNLLIKRLNEIILTEAQEGAPDVEICISDYIIGVENIEEYIEMLSIMNKTLTDSGFDHKILPNGKLLISWK